MESFLLTIDLYDHYLIKIYEQSSIVREEFWEYTNCDYLWVEYDIPGVGKICSFTGKEIGEFKDVIFKILEQFKYEIIKHITCLQGYSNNEPEKFCMSSELAEFIGAEREVSRPFVVKKICDYIKKHNLQKEDNGTEIDLTKPGGKKLADVLGIPIDTNLTFYNMHKYLIMHNIKNKLH